MPEGRPVNLVTAGPRWFAKLWRRSLTFRVMALTMGLSMCTIFVIGGVMSTTIANDLFNSRLQQSLSESDRIASQTQSQLNSIPTGDRRSLFNVTRSAINSAIQGSEKPVQFEFRPSSGTKSANSLPTITSEDFDQAIVTSSLRESVEAKPTAQYYQPVTIKKAGHADVPGIIVGTGVRIPSNGQYELYVVFDLSDSQSTLEFVQRTLSIGGIVLTLLVGGITLLVLRLIFDPIRTASRTSERFAAGDLDVRIPERGEDLIATLSRSFNRMADSLQEQITQLATLSELQQRFVSDVSHELRTPLTTIKLAGDLLYDQRESFQPSAARTTELLHTQIDRFDLLLGDLLEISRFDAGAVELASEPTNMVRLAAEVVDLMLPMAERRDMKLRLIAAGGHLDAEMDARRIRRILRNLIGNAIEHGEGHPVHVFVDSNESAVAVSVRDYGIGMSEDERAKVFDRFWRADPSRQRTMGGTGLGLAISLEDANLHGGRLEVWSERGQGSNFRLTLPRITGGTIEASPLPLVPVDADGREGSELAAELWTGALPIAVLREPETGQEVERYTRVEAPITVAEDAAAVPFLDDSGSHHPSSTDAVIDRNPATGAIDLREISIESLKVEPFAPADEDAGSVALNRDEGGTARSGSREGEQSAHPEQGGSHLAEQHDADRHGAERSEPDELESSRDEAGEGQK